jgi:hypothetical protein
MLESRARRCVPCSAEEELLTVTRWLRRAITDDMGFVSFLDPLARSRKGVAFLGTVLGSGSGDSRLAEV